MAAQKPVKKAAKASKTPASSKKSSQQKEAKPAKGASLKGLSVAAKKQSNKKAPNKETKAAKPTLKKSAAKPTKSSSVVSIIKNVVKTVEKKLKEPVKKTPEADKKETKPVSGKKQATTEKKPKVEAPVEQKTKPVAAKASTAKPAKSETEKNINKPVVIPKTSTDKKVDYEPDFLKSVLDAPASVSSGPTMRYSDGELQEFRDLIGKKLDAAKKELAYLQGLITRRDEMGGDETDNRYMTMEDGGMSMEREQLSQMASRQITFIDHLEKAIMRIENKTYGICRVTGKLIDKARLRAVPHATLSMEAKLGITK